MIAKTLENQQLLDIQRQSSPEFLVLPGYQDVGYNIDLSTRTVQSPEFLSVEKDHNSEVKYFIVDRYFDHKDLSTSVGVIQYINANGDQFIYPIPFFDTLTLKDVNKMIIPWNIGGSATAYAGDIVYSFRFYEFEKNIDLNGDAIYGDLIYNLNTLPATSKILHGLDVSISSIEAPYVTNPYETLVSMINDDSRKVIYWNIIN